MNTCKFKESIKNSLVNRSFIKDSDKVYVDEYLKNMILPTSLRKQTEGSMLMARGSKMPLDMGKQKVLRFFMYWKQSEYETDLDLSVKLYNRDFTEETTIAFYNLKNAVGQHSGDIISAPYGASEFIDINIDKLYEKYPDYEYIVPSIYMYSGEKLNEVESCYFGWMFRDIEDFDTPFDIKTVKYKLNPNGTGRHYWPVVFNMASKEVQIIDVYSGSSKKIRTAEDTTESIKTIIPEVFTWLHKKPNLYDTLMLYIEAVGAEIVSKEDANLVFDESLLTDFETISKIL